MNNMTAINALNKESYGWQDKYLTKALVAWCGIALLGQWSFALYIAVVYGVSLGVGQPELTHAAKPIMGYVAGDAYGNLMFFIHVLPAAILSMSGLLQLLPWLRRQKPHWHKWNGRLFLTLGFMGALSGLYLTWGRGARLSDVGALGTTINGVLILITVFFAWRFAVARQFDVHKRWAVHAFILVNGVWTFRLYLMSWYLLSQGGWGNTKQLDGPADIAISFACYLLPMLVFEVTLWAAKTKTQFIKLITLIALCFGCLLTAFGVFAAITFMWLPRISQVLQSFA